MTSIRQQVVDYLSNSDYPLLLSFGLTAATSLICEIFAKTSLTIESLKETCDTLEAQLKKELEARQRGSK